MSTNITRYRIKNLVKGNSCRFSKPIDESYYKPYFIIKAKTKFGASIYLGYKVGKVTVETNYLNAFKFYSKQKGIAMIYNQAANNFRSVIEESTVRIVEVSANAIVTGCYKIIA